MLVLFQCENGKPLFTIIIRINDEMYLRGIALGCGSKAHIFHILCVASARNSVCLLLVCITAPIQIRWSYVAFVFSTLVGFYEHLIKRQQILTAFKRKRWTYSMIHLSKNTGLVCLKQHWISHSSFLNLPNKQQMLNPNEISPLPTHFF